MMFPKVRELNINTKAAPTMVGAWLVEGKIDYSSYEVFIVAVFHLRPHGGQKANKASHRMTHELLITPLAATVPDLNIENKNEWPIAGTQIAEPLDINLQYRASNDTNALYWINPLVEMIKTGAIGVTRQWTQHWVQCLAQGTGHRVFANQNLGGKK